jgi:hypothetical protein
MGRYAHRRKIGHHTDAFAIVERYCEVVKESNAQGLIREPGTVMNSGAETSIRLARAGAKFRRHSIARKDLCYVDLACNSNTCSHR